jgi:two-component system chemotaxis response regulator CheY
MSNICFIVIDDDEFNNAICRMVIRRSLNINDIEIFIKPEDALGLIVANYKKYGVQKKTIVLLDLNMPLISGWDFLTYFDKLDKDMKENIYIFMLSSSIDEKDKIKAEAHPYVYAYLMKPLTSDILKEVMTQIN